MAAALIARLLHHCHVVNIRGNSYRMRHHSELWTALNSPPESRAKTTKPSRKGKEPRVPAG